MNDGYALIRWEYNRKDGKLLKKPAPKVRAFRKELTRQKIKFTEYWWTRLDSGDEFSEFIYKIQPITKETNYA